MNSKIEELKNLIRKEIRRALNEDLPTDVLAAKKAKLTAAKKLADLQKKQADADLASAQKGLTE